jgi:hypothetical protein
MAANNLNSMAHFPETPFDDPDNSAYSTAIATTLAAIDAPAVGRLETQRARFGDTRSVVASDRQMRVSAVSRFR